MKKKIDDNYVLMCPKFVFGQTLKSPKIGKELNNEINQNIFDYPHRNIFREHHRLVPKVI